MGKGGTPKVEVTQFYMSQHFGVCIGPPDALLKLTVNEKEAWAGEQTALGAITIDQPSLFGGIKKEGGLGGLVHWLPGEADQVLPDALAQKLGRANGADCPGFRGLASLFFYGTGGWGFYWTANAPYLPGVWATVRRILLRSDGSEQWYPSRARIASGYEIVEGATDIVFLGQQGEETLGSPGTPITFSLTGGTESTPTAGSFVVILVSSGRYPLSSDSYHAAPVGYEPLTEPYSAESSLADFTFRAYYKFMGGTPDTSFVPGTTTDAGARNAFLVMVFSGVDEAVFASEVTQVNGTGPATYSPADITIGTEVIDPGDIGSSVTTSHYVFQSLALLSATGTQAMPLVVGGQCTGGGAAEGPGNLLAYFQKETGSSSGTRSARSMGIYGQAVQLVTGDDMNPTHIVYECLTDTIWGMGTPSAALDAASFTAAADTLYAEGFGVSMLWTRQAPVEDFVQEVLDHIQAVLYVDPATGLLTLTLIRGDYEAAGLPELTPDNADLSSFKRKLWGEIVNEITVTWTNPENEQEETITAHDLASISMQGGVVPDSRNYYGVRNDTLAQKLAWRDLRSAGQPLASCDAEVDRSLWDLRPASVVKLTWPEYGLSEVVFRVMAVDYGRPGDMSVKLSLVEDTFGLDIGTYEAPPTTEWVDPSAAPEPLDEVEILTLPYFFAANTTVAAFVDSPEYPEVIAGVLGTTAESDTWEYELWDELPLPNGDLEWQQIGIGNIIGRAALAVALEPEATTAAAAFGAITGQTVPTIGGFVIIGAAGETGNEIAMIDAGTDPYTLIRGVLDTIPRSWPIGTPCWFVDASTLFEDDVVRAAGETVGYKLRTRTSLGLLALGAAPLESYALTDRPWLPTRPAGVLAYGEAWTTELLAVDATERPDPWVTVSWFRRNRLEEDSQVLAWTDGDVAPETGQTTTIEVRSVDDTLLATHDGLAGTSFDVPDASFGAEAVVRLRTYSERTDSDGDFVSLQYFEHWVRVGGSARFTEEGDRRATEGGDPRVTED